MNYGLISGEKRVFGSCDFEVSGNVAEPASEIRGNIARTYFYMNNVYPGRIKLDSEEKKMFLKWDKSDPVDKWECERSRRIKKLQGNENTFVEDACRKTSK